MPAPRHTKLLFSGDFHFGGSLRAEQWQFGVSATPPPVGTDPIVHRDALNAVTGAMVNAWQTRIAPISTTSVRFTRARAVTVAPQGGRLLFERDENDRYLLDDRTTDNAGAGTSRWPTDMALAVTLQSGLDMPSGRGRYYLPCPHFGALGDTLRLTGTQAGQMADANRLFLLDLMTAVNAAWSGGLVVASAGSPTRGLSPALRLVTSIKVGRRLDHQSRREEDLPEDYTEQLLAPS